AGKPDAVDRDPVGTPIRPAPAPERRDNAKAGADLEAGFNRLGNEIGRWRNENWREIALRPVAVSDDRVVYRNKNLIRLRWGDHDGGAFLAHRQMAQLVQPPGFEREVAQLLNPRHHLGRPGAG